MYIEDFLLRIKRQLMCSPLAFDGLLDGWYHDFIGNISRHIEAGKQLSTSQGQTILKMIAKVRRPIIRSGLATEHDIDAMLRYPQYRKPLYESVNIPREVRHLGDNLLGFRFKQNELIVDRIKVFGQVIRRSTIVLEVPKPHFDWNHRIWIVPVLRYNVLAVIALINEYRFHTDSATSAYLRLIKQSFDKPSAVILVPDHGVILANVCDNPLLASWITEVGHGVAV